MLLELLIYTLFPYTTLFQSNRKTSHLISTPSPLSLLFFFFNDPAPPEIYTLPLPDALPISPWTGSSSCTPTTSRTPRPRRCGCRALRARPPTRASQRASRPKSPTAAPSRSRRSARGDRKSTPLNSSHPIISYALFCF